jgi:hypothetical protein
MNGISSTLKDEIKKSKESKHKEKFKFLTALLITNVMVALLCLPMGQTKVNTQAPLKTIHSNHQMLVMPLTALVAESNLEVAETPVSLISKDKKRIVEKAFLHQALRLENGMTQFKIEINNQDVVKVSEYAELGMVAVPYVETPKAKVILKRGSKYEVSI